MLNFQTFINENLEKFTKLNHLEHVEDLPIDSGEYGYQHAIDTLKNVHKKLQGKFNETKVTTKYDGSPAVIFGHNPENGRFFVGTKAALSKNPKLNYTSEDIEKNHGEHPGLVGKLKTALEHLPKVVPKSGVYQGDYMYDQDSVHTHEGIHHFTPNTIQYSVPEKSDEGEKVAKAKLGIVIHTKYHGRDLANMTAGFDPDIHKFKEHSAVHIIPHEVGEVLHTGANQKAFEHHINAVESAHSQAHPDTFKDIYPHAEYIKKYINNTVRNGTKPSIAGYRQHLLDQGSKDVAALKTALGKQKHHEALLGKLHHVEAHSKQFESFFKIHHHLQKTKDALVDSLAHSSPFEHSINGKETKPEGFVAIHKTHPTKLVNRSEFSRANFNKH